jgi:hypothetical protein
MIVGIALVGIVAAVLLRRKPEEGVGEVDPPISILSLSEDNFFDFPQNLKDPSFDGIAFFELHSRAANH